MWKEVRDKFDYDGDGLVTMDEVMVHSHTSILTQKYPAKSPFIPVSRQELEIPTVFAMFVVSFPDHSWMSGNETNSTPHLLSQAKSATTRSLSIYSGAETEIPSA